MRWSFRLPRDRDTRAAGLPMTMSEMRTFMHAPLERNPGWQLPYGRENAMPMISELIGVADRQIARLKLLAHQQALHLECLEHGHHNAEAKRARVTLDLMLGE